MMNLNGVGRVRLPEETYVLKTLVGVDGLMASR